MKPRLLDLFCGAGGAAMGYAQAGFEVLGVDINPQPDYPFKFIQWDALDYLQSRPRFLPDAIHASPPCQAYTSMRHLGKRAGEGAPDLVDKTRELLEATGLDWIMENVAGSPLRNPLVLCGSTFGLGVRRHRLFESNLLLFGGPCQHGAWGRPIAVYGDHPQQPGDKTYRVNRAHTLKEGQRAMGIDWMPWKSLTQAIPPAYTEHLGRQLLAVFERRRDAA